MIQNVDPDNEKALAIELFNQTWTMLDKLDAGGLSEAEQEDLLHCAHASAWHWSRVGTAKNRAISHWQISRANAKLGHSEAALHHARRSLEQADAAGRIPWMLASAYEGLARAYALGEDSESAQAWKAKALATLDEIEDPKDREIVERDIASLPL